MGPNIFCCSKIAVTRRRSKLWWRKAHQSKALVELQRSRRSKRHLKPSGTISFWKIGPWWHIKGALLQKKETHFRKNVKNQFWPVLQYVKKYAEFNGAIRFGWNLLKSWVFDDFHFWYFSIFLYFLYFLCLPLLGCFAGVIFPFFSLFGVLSWGHFT